MPGEPGGGGQGWPGGVASSTRASRTQTGLCQARLGKKGGACTFAFKQQQKNPLQSRCCPVELRLDRSKVVPLQKWVSDGDGEGRGGGRGPGTCALMSPPPPPCRHFLRGCGFRKSSTPRAQLHLAVKYEPVHGLLPLGSIAGDSSFIFREVVLAP